MFMVAPSVGGEQIGDKLKSGEKLRKFDREQGAALVMVKVELVEDGNCAGDEQVYTAPGAYDMEMCIESRLLVVVAVGGKRLLLREVSLQCFTASG
jgi:hypothetical protein